MRVLGYRSQSDIQWEYREVIISEKHILEKYWILNDLFSGKNLDKYYFVLRTSIGIIEAPHGEMDRIVTDSYVIILMYHKALIMTEGFEITDVGIINSQNKIVKWIAYKLEIKRGGTFRADLHMYFD